MKKYSWLIFGLVSIFFLSGCDLNFASNKTVEVDWMPKATVIKTVDGGSDWQAKVRIDDKKNITTLNVLTGAIDPFDSNRIYLGSEKNGIFLSEDGAESWVQVKFPEKVYSIVLDHQNQGTVYASGALNKRGKIFKKVANEDEWKEIYTEPSDDTVVSYLAMNPFNSNMVYAGTSAGVIFRTIDGGNTWNNVYKAEAPIISIAFDSQNPSVVYFGVFQRGILKTTDAGEETEEITNKILTLNGNRQIFSVVTDPYHTNRLYAGTADGIIKSVDGGENWEELDILGSSKNFPIRCISINPQNSNELMYVAGKAIYKTTDGGERWSTFQLDTEKNVSRIIYDTKNPANVYATLRSFQ